MVLEATDWQALWVTFKLASVTTFILLLLSLPGAWLVQKLSPRWRITIDTLTTLPLILPPTVLGYYLLLAFSPQSSFGAGYEYLFNKSLAFSFEGILIASLIYSLPFAFKPIQAAFEQQGAQLSEAAALMGFSPWQSFIHVLLPNIKPAIYGAATLTFAHTVGEFGVILMIGGNIEGLTKVASVALYDRVENLEYAQANQLALILFVFSCSVVFLSQYLRSKNARSNPSERELC